MLLIIAALLITITSLAHSYLGERYLIGPIIARGDLPRLSRKRPDAAALTLRFAWHITSIAWLGIAAYAVGLTMMNADPIKLFCGIMAITFGIHTLLPLVIGRGWHKSWVPFLGITVAFGWLALTS